MCLASSSSEMKHAIKWIEILSFSIFCREVNATFPGSHLIFTAMGGPSCFSNVGRVGGNGQFVNLGSPECLHMGVVIHEILHALGSFLFCYTHSELSLKVLCMNTQDQTVISMSRFSWKIFSLAQSKTLRN